MDFGANTGVGAVLMWLIFGSCEIFGTAVHDLQNDASCRCMYSLTS